MGFWNVLILFIKYLPELATIVSALEKMSKQGYEQIQIARVCNALDEAWSIEDAQKRAKALNGIFKS